MKLRSRTIGRLGITVYATTDQGPSDADTKTLFVKVCAKCDCASWFMYYLLSPSMQPGCEKFEVTQNIYLESKDVIVLCVYLSPTACFFRHW